MMQVRNSTSESNSSTSNSTSNNNNGGRGNGERDKALDFEDAHAVGGKLHVVFCTTATAASCADSHHNHIMPSLLFVEDVYVRLCVTAVYRYVKEGKQYFILYSKKN